MHCRSGFKKEPTSCPPTSNWAPAIPNGRFFQRSESPRNISGSSEILDLCCMLNHFSAKLPKLSKLMIGGHGRCMYRAWRPSESHTCRGLSVRLGDSHHRAETPLHGWGKDHPVQKELQEPPWHQFMYRSWSFQGTIIYPKVHQQPPRCSA